MGWVDTYHEEAITPNVVDHEGNYQLKVKQCFIDEIKPKEGTNEGSKKYFRIECIINAPGYPTVSIFLTEGPKFNQHATAFFDTFGIPHGDFNSNNWVNRVGWMRIELKRKGEYVNMEPRYILDENGHVMQPSMQNQVPTQPALREDQYGDIPF